MAALTRLGLLLTGSLLSAGISSAQTITPLVVTGDVLSNGVVTRIDNVDVNDSGDWLAEVDTDQIDSGLDAAILHNGTELYLEGTSIGFPTSHSGSWYFDFWADSLDVNDHGDVLVLMNVRDYAGTSLGKKLAVWTSGASGTSHALLEEGVTPNTVAGEPAGAVWKYIEEVWQNNNNQLIVAGISSSDSDQMLAVLTHDGMGTITNQTVFAITNVNHGVAFPPSNGAHLTEVQGFNFSKQGIALNDAGQKMFYVDDDHVPAGGDVNADSHYYIDTTEVLWEGDDAPTSGTFPFNHLSNAEVDINDNGNWVASVDDDNPDLTQDFFILVDGQIYQQEGQAPPGMASTGFVMTGYSFGRVQISDFGDITWFCDWDDPDETIDTALWRNSNILVQEGVTTIGGVAVDTISSSSDGMAASDNGRFIIQELTMADGVEGAYLIEIEIAGTYCFGDGSATFCPCGNSSAGSEGCMNSLGAGALLTASGSNSVMLDDLVLSASQLPPGVTGLFLMGDHRVNGGMGTTFGDGLSCIGGTLVNLQVVSADGSGDASSSISIASTFGRTAGTSNTLQLWYRDNAGPCSSRFNTSNALAIDWQ